MSSKTVCPNCKKVLSVGSEVHGRQIRCPGCSKRFVVKIDLLSDANLNLANPDRSTASAQPKRPQSSYEEHAANLLESDQSNLAPKTRVPKVPSPNLLNPSAALGLGPTSVPGGNSPGNAPAPMGPGRYVSTKEADDVNDALPGFAKFGGSLMVLGLLGILLPFFGLQLKILNFLGEGSWIGGVAIGILGSMIVAIGYLTRRDWLMSLLLGGTPAVFFIIAAAIAAALIQSLSNPSSRTANDQNDLGLGAGGAINNSVATAKPASTTPQAAAAAPSWSPEPTETGFERNPPGSRHRSASSDFASAASGSAVAEDSRTALPSQFNTEALETSSSSSPLEKPNWSFAGRTNKDRAQSYQILFARQFKMRLSAADARKISAEEKTIVVGSTDRAANITMDSARKPILGLDYAAKITDENVLGIMVPVFERSEGFTVIAEEGYALGGLRVYAREKVLGFQPIFMKLDGDTLNPTDSYTGDWEGAKGSDDQIVRLAGDGRIVCGLCIHGAGEVNGLGLIVRGKAKSNE